jgi:hypothetical protein
VALSDLDHEVMRGILERFSDANRPDTREASNADDERN